MFTHSKHRDLKIHAIKAHLENDDQNDSDAFLKFILCFQTITTSLVEEFLTGDKLDGPKFCRLIEGILDRDVLEGQIFDRIIETTLACFESKSSSSHCNSIAGSKFQYLSK